MNFKISQPENWVVWFDLDDTLWDFTNNSHQTLQKVFHHYNLERYWPDINDWIRIYHQFNDPLWDDLSAGKITHQELRFKRFYDTFVSGGMPESEAAAKARPADSFYLDNLGKCPNLVAGAIDLIVRLKTAGFKIGVLSNGFSEVQYCKLQSGNLLPYIDFIVLSDEAGVSKPDPRIFEYAKLKAEVDASHCIMIGDNGETDISGAINAGWSAAIWYNPNGRLPGNQLVNALSRKCCLLVVDNLIEIPL